MASVVDRLFGNLPAYGSEIVTIKKTSEKDLPEIACFDYITLETTAIPYSVLTKVERASVAADERTVVLHFPSASDSYVCVDLKQLVELLTYKNSKFYECRGADYQAEGDSDDRRGSSIIRMAFGPGGSYFSVFTNNLKDFLDAGDRIVSVVTIPNSTVERTISEDALKQRSEGAYVSTNHCQAGSSLSLSYLAKTAIEGVPILAKYDPLEYPFSLYSSSDDDAISRDSTDDYADEPPFSISSDGTVLTFLRNLTEPLIGFSFTGITSVYFNEDFNSSISGIDWGLDLETLSLGNSFNQPINDVSWGRIETVDLGDAFNQPIDGVNWGSVDFLKFGYSFNQPIRQGVDWGNIAMLVLGDSFNQPINRIDWQGVSIVQFGESFNQSVKRVDWKNMKSVGFGAGFRHSLSGIDWKLVQDIEINDFYEDVDIPVDTVTII